MNTCGTSARFEARSVTGRSVPDSAAIGEGGAIIVTTIDRTKICLRIEAPTLENSNEGLRIR
jgi:hypothetical protein